MINKLKEKKLKCNIDRSFFGHTKMELLRFYATRNGVNPINIKI